MSQHPEGSQSTTATSGVESVQRPNLPLQGPRSDDISRSAGTSTFGPFLDYLLLNYYGELNEEVVEHFQDEKEELLKQERSGVSVPFAGLPGGDVWLSASVPEVQK